MQFCPICQEDSPAVVAAPCRHVFCEPCIARWKTINPTCPSCRAPLSAAAGVDWLRVVHLLTSGAALSMLLYIMRGDAACRTLDNGAAALKILLHVVIVNWDLIHYFIRHR